MTDFAGLLRVLHENKADCLCLDLEMLIRVKRAAGRPKDFEAIVPNWRRYAKSGKPATETRQRICERTLE